MPSSNPHAGALADGGGSGLLELESRSKLPGSLVRVMLVRDPGEPYSGTLTRPAAVFEFLKDEVATWDRERFLTLMLDSSHRLIGIEEVAVGTVNSAVVHPREVFKALILANATAFIAVHNHPSGQPLPSIADIEITERLRKVGELVGIQLLDHIIIANREYHAFSEHQTF